MNLRELINIWIAKKGYWIGRTAPAVLRENAQLNLGYEFIIKHELLRQTKEFYFVQIGANDGVSRSDDLFELIRKYNVKGLMLEPQAELFKQLQLNMKDYPGVKLVNMAIHKDKKHMPLYRLTQESLNKCSRLPLWAKTNGIASFDKEHVVRHAKRIGLDESAIESQDVECISMNALLEQYGKNPDLLKIDTEGYDYEVLSMLDFDRWKPRIIRFEHLHMSSKEHSEIIRRLKLLSYYFIADKMNTTAYCMNELS